VGRAAVCAVLSALWPAAIQAQGSDGVSDGFKQTVRPFFQSYCLECHDEETKKGGVSLEGLTEVSVENAAMWRRIWEQVALKEMPPRKETDQPKLSERLELSNWITGKRLNETTN